MPNHYTLDMRQPHAAVTITARPVIPKVPAKAPQPALKCFACPMCSGSVVRVHRHLADVVVGLLTMLPVRRYRCRRNGCGWGGILEHVTLRRSGDGIDSRYRARLQRL